MMSQTINRTLVRVTIKIIAIISSLMLLTGTCYSTTHTHHVVKKKSVTHTKQVKHSVSKQKKTQPIQHSHKKIKYKKIAIKKSKKKRTHHITRVIPKSTITKTQVNATNITQSHLPGYLLSSIEKTLVNFVRTTISTLRYTTYKLGGTKIDDSKGIYVVDCSSYVDHILKTIYPHAFTSLTTWSGTEKPTTDDFYHYFMNLSDNSTHWNMIDDVEELRPGDILVFRSKNKYGVETGGHVMIIMDKPIRDGNVFILRIADSAPSGHSKDTRMPHASGIGIGSMLLKVHPKTYHPYAYAWKVGSRWESNVNFAMARPVDFG